MGCLGGAGLVEKPDITIEGLDEMLNEIAKGCIEIEKKFPDLQLKREKEQILNNRHEALQKEDKSNESQVESTVKDFNKKELDIDNKLIENKFKKMQEQYELGLKVALKAKEKLIGKLEQQLQKATSAVLKNLIGEYIEKIKKLSPAGFLDSEFGKPIKDALEKQGLSETALKSYKEELRNERTERRKKEREEFGIKQNEWPEEEMYDDDKENFYQKMLDEYKDKMELK